MVGTSLRDLFYYDYHLHKIFVYGGPAIADPAFLMLVGRSFEVTTKGGHPPKRECRGVSC